jgi:hypothetical protein
MIDSTNSSDIAERQYGRKFIVDKRDKMFKLQVETTKVKSKLWSNNKWIGNQLTTPKCVGFAWAGWLYAAPYKQWLDPSGIYTIAQFLDEWGGESYDGTSVRAGAKVLQMLGAIKEYRWSWDATEVANHILSSGPVVLGTNWYADMSTPDSKYLIHPTGQLMGGHCYLLLGYDTIKKQFTMLNSWGVEWGKKGFAYITSDDLQSLLDNEGEACVGIEQPFTPNTSANTT